MIKEIPCRSHYPEVCYPAQGFSLKGKEKGTVSYRKRNNSSHPNSDQSRQRNEPVTYWTTVGDQVFQGGIQKKLVEIGYGLNGKIPDGMLIRISSIDSESPHAFTIQEQFADQMLRALAPQYRQKLNGNL